MKINKIRMKIKKLIDAVDKEFKRLNIEYNKERLQDKYVGVKIYTGASASTLETCRSYFLDA